MAIFENGIFDTVGRTAVAAGAVTVPGSDAERRITGFSIDSRKIRPGDLFIAIKGERLDGHDYIKGALERGASAVLCERVPQGIEGNFILAENSTYALGRLARAYKNQIGVRSVAVTGSVGKTTTKQFIYSVFKCFCPTQKTEGNLNNEIGLPLTLLSLEKGTETAVLEMGMNNRGEMHRLSLIGEPDIACITNIGTAHIENLGTREGIAEEKLWIADGLRTGGTLLLNGDEPLLAGKDALYIGRKNLSADFRISDIRQERGRIFFDFESPFGKFKNLQINTIGVHNVLDASFAVAAGLISGCGEDVIRCGLLEFENTGMRQHIFDLNGIHIIEDCYNASAESMEASLAVLKERALEYGGRAVAVLGDMKELGEHSAELHRRVGRAAADIGADLLFTYGEEADKISEGFKVAYSEKEIEKKSAAVYNINSNDTSVAEFAGLIRSQLKEGDTVLFKASRAMKFEEVIAAL